ncbi:hypothetical protein FACS189474_1120 [Bacteroidia bacterium]|nr:hypothetical protein FACS189474_1120 [Bacteroidia bacterium]
MKQRKLEMTVILCGMMALTFTGCSQNNPLKLDDADAALVQETDVEISDNYILYAKLKKS